MIAISYRREDSLPIAGRLYDRLQTEFGRDKILMDFDSIPFGVDFRDHIKQMIEGAKVVLALIGPDWAGRISRRNRRIDDPTDFVRLEIEYALHRNVPIIPILIGNTRMPNPAELPNDIRALAFQNALNLDPGRDFHHHVSKLISAVNRIAAETPAAPDEIGTSQIPGATTTPAGSDKLEETADRNEPEDIPTDHPTFVRRSPSESAAPAIKKAARSSRSISIGTMIGLGLLVAVIIAATYLLLHRKPEPTSIASRLGQTQPAPPIIRPPPPVPPAASATPAPGISAQTAPAVTATSPGPPVSTRTVTAPGRIYFDRELPKEVRFYINGRMLPIANRGMDYQMNTNSKQEKRSWFVDFGTRVNNPKQPDQFSLQSRKENLTNHRVFDTGPQVDRVQIPLPCDLQIVAPGYRAVTIHLARPEDLLNNNHVDLVPET